MDRRRLIRFALAAALFPAAAWANKPKREKGDDKGAGQVSYLPIPTLTATVLRPDGRRGVMSVDLGLDISDKALRDKAQLVLPRLRAAFVQTVQVYAAGMPQGPPPSVDYLSRELQRQTDLTLGRPGAKLLLGSVLVN